MRYRERIQKVQELAERGVLTISGYEERPSHTISLHAPSPPRYTEQLVKNGWRLNSQNYYPARNRYSAAGARRARWAKVKEWKVVALTKAPRRTTRAMLAARS